LIDDLSGLQKELTPRDALSYIINILEQLVRDDQRRVVAAVCAMFDLYDDEV
jgi:hypothetical protein